MFKVIIEFIKPYLRALAIGLVIGAVLYVVYLNWRVSSLEGENKELEDKNTQLSVDLSAQTRQVEKLNDREIKSQKIEANYEKARNTAKGKEGGSVGPALRYAIDTDILPE